MESKKKKKRSGIEMGVILILIGAAITFAATAAEKQYIKEAWRKRNEYLDEKWPSGVYRGEDFLRAYNWPMSSGPASGWISIGSAVIGFGMFMIIIKLIQQTP